MPRVYDRFVASLPARGEGDAVVVDGVGLSARDFAAIVEEAAAVLTRHGVFAGDRVAIALPNAALHGALLLAVSKARAVAVSFDPDAPEAMLAALIRRHEPRVVVSTPARAEALGSALDIDGVVLAADLRTHRADAAVFHPTPPPRSRQPGPGEDAEDAGCDPDPLFILCTTSGSTGDPKPIALTQGTKLLRAEIAAQAYGLGADDRILLATPLHHTLAQRLFFLPMILGGVSVIQTQFDPGRWIETVAAQKITFTIAVSSQLAQLAAHIEGLAMPLADRLASLKCVVASSSTLADATKDALLRTLTCPLYECYGTSETATVTHIDLRAQWSKRASVGHPLPGVAVRILDAERQPVATGGVGEIAIRTRQIFSGYHQMPEQTAAAFHGDYFLTGDLGRFDEDGFLYFAGRSKELIKSGGVSVYPFDVEAAACRVEGVIEACAFAAPDARLGECVVLQVTTSGDPKRIRRALRRHLLETLAPIQQPRFVEVVPALPRTATGKIDKISATAAFRKEHVQGHEH